MPQRNAAGRIDALRVAYRLREDGRPLPDLLGVRVRVPSGSDATCDQPVPPDWLKLASIDYEAGRGEVDGSVGASELVVPPDPDGGILTIRLATPVRDANAIEVDMVRRGAEAADA